MQLSGLVSVACVCLTPRHAIHRSLKEIIDLHVHGREGSSRFPVLLEGLVVTMTDMNSGGRGSRYELRTHLDTLVPKIKRKEDNRKKKKYSLQQ